MKMERVVCAGTHEGKSRDRSQADHSPHHTHCKCPKPLCTLHWWRMLGLLGIQYLRNAAESVSKTTEKRATHEKNDTYHDSQRVAVVSRGKLPHVHKSMM
jgi:hypothetical protein